MDISCRGRYATRAMAELASHDDHTPIPLSKIAENQQISRKYLQQLMSGLRRAGLVRVAKGFKGGFMLSRPASEINVGEILRALEGDLDLVECVRHEGLCDRDQNCLTRGMWTKASRMLEEYFDSISLADLLNGDI